MVVLLFKPAPAIPAMPVGCSLSFSTSATYLAPTATASGRRIYLFHGLNSPTMWESGTPLELVTALRANGDEVVLPVLPTAQACFFSNGGWQYREQFVAALNAIKTSVEASHGLPDRNIVGGISYGGLHAMMAAISTGHFASWFAHLPVTRIDALSEFPSVGDVRRFNPILEAGSLEETTGRISWGTADTRVDYTLTVSLSGQLGSGVTKVEYPGLGHETTSQGAADLAAWVAAH